MDIESKRYRVRSSAPGQAEIVDKATGRSAFVPAADVPSAHALAMMHESTFDRAMAELAGG